ISTSAQHSAASATTPSFVASPPATSPWSALPSSLPSHRLHNPGYSWAWRRLRLACCCLCWPESDRRQPRHETSRSRFAPSVEKREVLDRGLMRLGFFRFPRRIVAFLHDLTMAAAAFMIALLLRLGDEAWTS